MLQKTRPLLTTSLTECYRISRNMFDRTTDLNERTSYFILKSLASFLTVTVLEFFAI